MTADEPTPLEREIRDRIARHGPIAIDAFMQLCLYDPKYGYYHSRSAIGAAGDFVTAPEISQMFGELLGLWTVAVWRLLGEPDPVLLVEMGPGRGTMMADALRAASVAPDFRKALRVHLVETSLEMQMRQRQTLAGLHDLTLRWHAALDEVPPGPVIILANEFFDALPIRQALRLENGWHERAVGINAGGELAFTVLTEPVEGLEQDLPPAVQRAAVGEIYEWRPHDLAAALAGRLGNRGAALVIDYGHVRSAPGDTFQAVRCHRYASPLALPGLTDLTAHVDFEALAAAARRAGARIHGPTGQGAFLKQLGIETRAAALEEAADAEQRAAVAAALKRLVGSGPNDMGSMFKVIGLTSPGIDELPGFAR